MSSREHRFTATLTWMGAPLVVSSDGPRATYENYSRAYRVEMPGKPAFYGSAAEAYRGDPALHNPEDMLVAALSACHALSYLAECARAGIDVISYRDEAEGTMAIQDKKMRFVSVLLKPEVVIADPARLEQARALHAAAHDGCFIANSVNFPVENQPSVRAA
ncbi:MAG TPA: OsmC family protein [Alphaproteobacteria bacterium]|nr:OsmC family protein [Alphaproteobacteria bacterium]